MLFVKPAAKLLWITPDAEKIIERSGRVCYKSENTITDESSAKFIRMIIDRKHESVLEHASASLLFICDRGVSHELVRHRLASYSQESTRYCNYKKDKFNNQITVIEPTGIKNDKQFMAWRESVLMSEKVYMKLIDDGISPQIARSVLPTCLKTEIVVTTNLREWRHIFNVRRAKDAHPQIRDIMEEAFRILS